MRMHMCLMFVVGLISCPCPRRSMPSAPCPPRNVFIDLGVNWGNTARLYELLDPAATRPYEVYGFEASPLIAPYAEQCALALSAGKPIPPAPVLPSGSSRELREFAPSLNCSYRDLHLDGGKHSKKLYPALMQKCVFAALRQQLTSLRPDRSLSRNASGLSWRLAQGSDCAAKTHFCMRAG